MLDAIYEMANGGVGVPLTRQSLVEFSGLPEAIVVAALGVLTDDVRRTHGLEFDERDARSRFRLVYVPLGDAYGAYRALHDAFDADSRGCASRRKMEQWQGRWRELVHVDFDAGLEAAGWARRCEGDEERWQMTPRGIEGGRSRLKLP